jgi:hypothetical protein
MMAVKLLIRLIVYYGVLGLFIAAALWMFPGIREYLPIGRVQELISSAGGTLQKGQAGIRIGHVDTFGGSLVWLVSALLGALATALPVAWIYMEVRNPEHYDQSLIGTIVMLPVVVTSIVIIVQDSLALSFSLAGITGAARFRNSLKSSGDLLFTLIAVGIGLAAGIGAMELAIVTTIIFNLCFVALWAIEFGERSGMKRYLQDFDPFDKESLGDVTQVEVSAMTMSATVVQEATEDDRKPEKPLP